MKFIIAPHEVQRARIEALRDKIPNSEFQIPNKNQIPNKIQIQNTEPGTVLFSELTPENAGLASVLIVDGIGYLSHLYQYATIAYIGGGFGVGIHNILEAATFGKPVIFGPNYLKFREAVELIEAGGAFSINNTRQLNNKTTELLENKELLTKSSEICSAYVQGKKGATAIILSSIKY
jgi:3-deoxy-D-manno-octulosonic-acid transferase